MTSAAAETVGLTPVEWRARLSRASHEFTVAVAEGRLRDAASFRLAVAVIEQLLGEDPYRRDG